MTRVVVLGGGTGLSTLLRGLKALTRHLTAIVAVSDDGGSSGRLRTEMGVLPPGDIRNCLVALADDESLLSALFSYRFETGDLSGHSFGNLFLAALTAVTGDFDLAIKESSRVLNIRGTVLPSTMADVRLAARLSDSRVLRGQSAISLAPAAIERVWLEPSGAEALPLALERIASADVVVLGPGSLFTSVLPPLLVRGVRDAVVASSAPVMYICNVMTQPGETIGFDAAAHLNALLDHLGDGLVDLMVVNTAHMPSELAECYAEEGARPVDWSGAEARLRGVRVVPLPLIGPSPSYARHDPALLAAAVVELASSIGRRLSDAGV